MALLTADEEIKSGASGGPILNDAGELVGLVSHSSVPKGNEKCDAGCALPLLALPVWVCKEFLERP